MGPWRLFWIVMTCSVSFSCPEYMQLVIYIDPHISMVTNYYVLGPPPTLVHLDDFLWTCQTNGVLTTRTRVCMSHSVLFSITCCVLIFLQENMGTRPSRLTKKETPKKTILISCLLKELIMPHSSKWKYLRHAARVSQQKNYLRKQCIESTRYTTALLTQDTKM